MTTDTIAQLTDDAQSVAFADALAEHLALRRMPLGATDRAPALLAVAPASRRHLRDLAVPLVTFSRSAAARPAIEGRVVLCGARDEGDAPALAIADAIAQALELRLLVAHVLPAIRPHASRSVVPPCGPTREERAWAAAMLARLAVAAGVEPPGDGGLRVLCGGAAADLAACARLEDAALVVVSATKRSRIRRMLSPSVARHLSRRCERPVLVCPKEPAAAMRVREALGWG